MTDDPPLNDRQQMMMAYIDEELGPNERSEFEQAMADDPDLAVETVKFKNLMDLSRSMALSEPTDHELRRFWSSFYNRAEWRLGWILLLTGVLIAAGEGLYLLYITDAVTWWFKGAILVALLGGGMLIWSAARVKLRTSHFDRYRGVMR